MSLEGGNFAPKAHQDSVEPTSPSPVVVAEVLKSLNAKQAELATAAFHEHHPEVSKEGIVRNDAMREWVEANAGAFRDLVDTDPTFKDQVLEASDAEALRSVLERIEGKSPLQ